MNVAWAIATIGQGWRPDVARGFESKAVEAQQQDAALRDAARRSGQADGSRPAMTAEQAQRAAERTTLMLARTRALSDLQRACAPAHRAMLEHAIRDLDIRLAALRRLER
jgi:hypothetical protein